MKRFVLSLVVLLALAGVAAVVTWKVVGPPDRSVKCDPENLPEHFVCLATVRAWPAEEVLWVDARPRVDWEKDGVEGSVLLNDQEEWVDLEPSFMMQMMVETKPKVVVYCNQSGCGSSKYVADQLREKHASVLGFETYVLEGGMKALLAEEGQSKRP